MRKTKILFSGLLAMLAILLATGCSENDNPTPTRTSLKIDTSDLVLSVGESAIRTAQTSAWDYQITYASSKPAVATVDQNGKVTALTEGRTVITVAMAQTPNGEFAATSLQYTVIVNKVSAAALVDVDKSTPLTLVAAEDGKITVTFNGGITLTNDIHYTINGGEEQTISKNTEGAYDITVSKGDVVALYSLNASLGGSGSAAARAFTRAVADGAGYINIKPSMKTEIYGNVMSLLKGKDNLENADAIEANNAFYGLFAGADKLVNSENRELVLPATTLKEGCYDNMFSGCKGIEKAPELPAPTLEKGCYKDMFSGCSKLASVKCLATDLSAEGSTDGWLANAGTEAKTTPVIETAKGANWEAVPDAIPDNFEKGIAVTNITLNATTLTLPIGKTTSLEAVVEPTEATDKSVEWTSSNEAVATVSAQGVVTAVAAGSAIITVSTLDGTVKATCEVKVEAEPVGPVLVTNIRLPETYITTSGTSTNYLTNAISISPSDAANKTVTWTSDNPDIVAVNEKGEISVPMDVTGVAHITATANDGSGVSATCTVTVKGLGSLYFMTEMVEKTAGSTFTNPLTHHGDAAVNYSSSNTEIATVDASTGEVTIAQGATVGQTVTITATASVMETDSYKYYEWTATSSYTVTIVAPTSQGEREDYTPGTW